MSSRRSCTGLLAIALALVVLTTGCGGSDRSDAATPTTAKSSASGSSTTTTAPATKVAAGAAVPSPGCGTSTTGALTDDRRTLDVDGTERWYLLTTPTQHDGKTPLPLVVDYHGLSEGAVVASKMSGFATLAQQDGFVVVQPNGTGTPVAWKVALQDNPDLTFTDDLLAQLGKDLCIDTSRVYATGLSNGAFMSSTLACARADRFAAVAPVAGVTYPDGCQTERKVPILAYHGTADPILYFNGGIGDLGGLMKGTTTAQKMTVPPADLNGAGYPANVRSWAAHNGCDATPKDTDVTATVVHRVYTCPSGAAVEFYILKGGGHSWPGSAFSQSIANFVGPTNMDIDASKLTWEFFQRFRLPTS